MKYELSFHSWPFIHGDRQGIPFDPDDPIFSPPDANTHSNLPNGRANSQSGHNLPIGSTPTSDLQPSRPVLRQQHKPRGSHGSNMQRIIPIDEDVRRLFEECDIAKVNAHILNDALMYARPEDLEEKSVIKVWNHIALISNYTHG
jgi:hypothetical protein